MKMKTPLDQIEAQLQNLIEGGVARLFPEASRSKSLPDRLLKTMRESTHPGPEETILAPNLYFIRLHPQDAPIFETHTILLESLSDLISDRGTEAGYIFSSTPVVRIQPDPFLRKGEFAITAVESQVGLTPTSGIQISPISDPSTLPKNAFLIVDGVETFPLLMGVVNIGRREDNHLVLSDPRVSRLHAQLRVVNGRFVIFDLDSTTGTLVNGRPVKQQELSPGDVILLGGTPLVFGEDTTGETGQNKSQP